MNIIVHIYIYTYIHTYKRTNIHTDTARPGHPAQGAPHTYIYRHKFVPGFEHLTYVPLFARPNGDIWALLVEKAMAKLYGCYEDLNGGRVGDALEDLTGGIGYKFRLETTEKEWIPPKGTDPDRLDQVIGEDGVALVRPTIEGPLFEDPEGALKKVGDAAAEWGAATPAIGGGEWLGSVAHDRLISHARNPCFVLLLHLTGRI